MCKDCGKLYFKEHNDAAGIVLRAELKQKLADWLYRCSLVPFRTLDEEDWIRACTHFNKCAICGKHSIELKTFFIQFKEGGGYTPWNIIPTCERCGKKLHLQTNPFEFMHSWLNMMYRPYKPEEKLASIVDYLSGVLEREMKNGV